MKPMTFRLRDGVCVPVDMQSLVPNLLLNKSIREIGHLQILAGTKWTKVGELFQISGEDCQNLAIENSTIRLERVGSRMSSGSINVFGSTGAFAGQFMRGGKLIVNGSTGSYAAMSMRGGTIDIQGSTGDFLGAGAPGSKIGMNGGTVLVSGDAGKRAANRMRRGLVVIQGNTGIGPCSGIIAGTVVLLGDKVVKPGIRMKRGTIVVANQPEIESATFLEQGRMNLLYLALLKKQMQELLPGFNLELKIGERMNRYTGDISCGGIGEILVSCS